MALALFAADRQLPNFAAGFGVQVRLKEMELHRPRQWGACWLACHFYDLVCPRAIFGRRLLYLSASAGDFFQKIADFTFE